MDIQSARIDEEVASQTPGKDALIYEETPPIEPINTSEPEMFPPQKPKNPTASIITTIIFFIILFIIGFWLSGSIRKYAGNMFKSSNQEQTLPVTTPKNIESTVSPTLMKQPTDGWNTFQVINGKTRKAYEGLSYKLPPEVLSPICDGSSCRSQGTYLPDGTRFTVALRGEGQVLPDYRGKVISDLNGIPLPPEEITLGGLTVTEFSGSFIGTTVGGYVFSQMRGIMIPITDVVSLEINHFSPKGIVSDFAKDDVLFDKIVQTLIFPSGLQEKGEVSSPSAFPDIVE